MVIVLQPLKDDRGIEAAGIGQHDFVDVAHESLSSNR
jgi:hypothetical protein